MNRLGRIVVKGGEGVLKEERLWWNKDVCEGENCDRKDWELGGIGE